MVSPMAGKHPFRLHGVSMAGGRLLSQYGISQPGIQVTAARLWWSNGELPATEVAPGILETPLPAQGGSMKLVVDAVSAPLADATPLPWEVRLRLPSEAIRDYSAAEPCGAVLDLADNGAIVVDRILRNDRLTAVFWKWRTPGPPQFWSGALYGELLVDGQPLHPDMSLYDTFLGLHVAAQAGQPGGPLLPVRVHAACFPPVLADQSLALHIHGVELQVGRPWSLEVDVPSVRPSVVAVGQGLIPGGEGPTLEEVWLSRLHTTLLFTTSSRTSVELMHGIALEDETGRIYQPTTGSAGDGHVECRFESIPPGVERLTLGGQGLCRRMHGGWKLPLEPGAQGAPFDPGPGLGWGRRSYGAMVSVSTSMPVQIPEALPAAPVTPGEEEVSPAPDREKLREWIQARLVPAQRLSFERVPVEELSPRESHLGGTPFRPAGEPWPACGFCGNPLTFVGQVRLDGLQSRPGDAELLTFYYCHECLPQSPDYAEGYQVRLHRQVDIACLESAEPPEIVTPSWRRSRIHYPCRIELTPVQSAPASSEVEAELESLDLGDRPWEVYLEEWQSLTGAPNMESRLGGYPDWIQAPEWPECPKCGQRMTLLWQLDSDEVTGLMWGDSGRVYIFTCPTPCSDQALALVMQCC